MTIPGRPVRAGEKDYHFMEKSMEEMQREVAAGRLGTEADTGFHMAIAYGTKNPLQVFIMKNFYDFLFSGIRANLLGLYQIEENLPVILKQHQSIYRAIRRQSPENAHEAMKRHIDFVFDFFENQN